VRDIVEHLQAQSRDLEGRLGDPAVLKDQVQYRALTREHARLKGILTIGERWLALAGRVEEDRQVLQTERDPELIQLVREELPDLERGLAEATAELEMALLPHDPIDDRDVILEVRAGTGGDEAALFAEEIARMYVRHAERRGWKVEPLEGTPGQAGGMKEVIYAVRGEGVYGILRWESGVHRVQRVPLTESQGRIHTSAVTVAVLPEADEVDVQIRPEELRIDVFRARGPGGRRICPPAWSSAARTRSRSTRTRPRRCRCCGPVCWRRRSASRRRPSRPNGVCRSAVAIAARRSAPTTSRRTG